MKDKVKNIKNRIQNQKGAVIVEAAIVFPVMFFVLFFIIFIGNLYYEQSRIDQIVLRYAIKGAECVADPFLYDYEVTNAVPNDTSVDVEPYKYIFGSMSGGSISAVEDKLSQAVKDEINDTSLIFFANSKAKVLGTDEKKMAKFHNYVVYSTFVVQVNYQIRLPISFMGEQAPPVLKFSSRAEVPVSDAPEFIRNVDMAVDLLDGTKTGDTIKSIFEKINGYINNFSK